MNFVVFSRDISEKGSISSAPSAIAVSFEISSDIEQNKEGEVT